MSRGEKRKRGRPVTGARFTIQKHIFLDVETADMLAKLGAGNESACVRELIQREFKRRRGYRASGFDC